MKNLYFERASEIERLQNILATQRVFSQRTSLDDQAYSSRFDRLDGAIKNLAFEIRQNWKNIPSWLQASINPGAEQKGGREMTIVGRAAISRWVADEILDRYFHPCLETTFSTHLKTIEHNIRRNSPQPQSPEEDDALSAKVCAWRMSTIDGVLPILDSSAGHETRNKLMSFLTDKLVSSLSIHLQEPTPPGLQGGVTMIVEIAVGLASNLPMESRDVRVWYPLPGEKFDTIFMRGEPGLPPPVNAPETAETDRVAEGKDGAPAPISKDENENKPGLQPSGSVSSRLTKENSVSGAPPKKQSKFNALKAKLPGGSGGQTSADAGMNQQDNPSQTNLAQDAQQSVSQPAQKSQQEQNASSNGPPASEKVRVAGFMAVEVRGKAILMKAPVWL